MKRVLAVIHTPNFGGPHNQALRLYEPLKRHGWETIVAMPQEAGSGAERLEAAGIRLARIPLGRLRNSLNPVTQLRAATDLWRGIGQLKDVIDDYGVDLVQIHGVQNPHGALAARRAGVPVVLQLLGLSAPRWVRAVLTPGLLRLSDVVMSTGTTTAAGHPGVTGLGDRWVSFVPPVDGAVFFPCPRRRAAARSELGVANDQILVGTVGNYFKAKGHEYLVAAAGLASKRCGRLVFRILGAPTPSHAAYYDSAVVKPASELERDGRLRFMNPGARVAELLPAFDIFVLSSVAEGMPNVILEAMACSLPVIATRVGSVGELIDDGVNGILVEPADPPALGAAIVELANDAGRRGKLAGAGRHAVVNRFSVEHCAATHVTAYERAMHGR